jgi:glyoxylase-like metal-dependent hydrolase (beta-lactamase superfamily II)
MFFEYTIEVWQEPVLIHEILPVGILQCNCSIFGDEVTREAMVIDPGDQIEDILAVLAKHQLTVKSIVITHAHIDHIGGAAKLKKVTGAPVYMHANDQELYDQLEIQAAWLGIAEPERTSIDTAARDGDLLRVGATEMQVLHTPGHTQGSLCLWIPAERKLSTEAGASAQGGNRQPGLLIAGDTLFFDSVGRTDLPGGNHRQLLASIKDKLYGLPEETLVVPGHGPSTTIGREKEHNYFLSDL